MSFELLANIRTQTFSHEVRQSGQEVEYTFHLCPGTAERAAAGSCWFHCQSTFGGRRVAEIDRNEVIKRFVIVTADKLSAVSFPREIRIDDGN